MTALPPLTAPPRPPVRRFICGAGPGPCGNPGARLYLCGWRCEECKPRPADGLQPGRDRGVAA